MHSPPVVAMDSKSAALPEAWASAWLCAALWRGTTNAYMLREIRPTGPRNESDCDFEKYTRGEKEDESHATFCLLGRRVTGRGELTASCQKDCWPE